MVRETPLQGLQETLSGSVSQASEAGDGLPQEALEKLDVAQASVQKLLKAITNLMKSTAARTACWTQQSKTWRASWSRCGPPTAL